MERPFSLKSGKMVAQALQELGHTTHMIDTQNNPVEQILEIKNKTDFFFIALHGPGGEDGSIQGLLEIMQLPYSHSGILASAIAMNKKATKDMVEGHVPIIPTISITKEELLAQSQITTPYIIKPVNLGSSVATMLISQKNIQDIQQYPFDLYPNFLVEKYIKGTELSTCIIDGQVIGTAALQSNHEGFFDFAQKSTMQNVQYVMPHHIPKHILDQAAEYTSIAYNRCRCEVIARMDFIYEHSSDTLYMLEINSHPGLTSSSLAPFIAKHHQNIEFNTLIDMILRASLNKYSTSE